MAIMRGRMFWGILGKNGENFKVGKKETYY